MKKILFSALMILGFLTLLWVNSPGGGEDKGVLRVGVSLDYPPFEFAKHGEAMGIDIDIARAVGQELGYAVEIVDMEFPALIPALNAGKVDFLASALTPTPERGLEVDFTEEYFKASLGLVYKKGESFETFESLAGKKVGTQMGSFMENFLKENIDKIPGATVRALPMNNVIIQELKVGHVSAVLVESAQAVEFAKKNEDLSYTILKEGEEGYAMALKKGSQLTEKLNGAIARLKEKGTIEGIKNKWIGDNSVRTSIAEFWEDVVYIVPGGIAMTLAYTGASIFFGLGIGVVLSLMGMSGNGLLRGASKSYISVFRGTPVLVQLSLIYFAIPGLTGLQVSIFIAGVLSFSLNSAAYIAEIIRAGIQSVEKGQFEAARALGVSKHKMMKDIIFPQALKNILPALVNEFVSLMKETAIISMIGGADLMRRAQIVAAEQYTYFGPLMITAVCYYVLVVTLSTFAKQLEKRMQAA